MTAPEEPVRQWVPADPKLLNPHPWGVGMPALLLLQQFGRVIHDAYGVYPYLVGSVLEYKTVPRDVDVRLILPAKHPDLRTFGKPYTRWATICAALALLGKQLTGLPIDFQIQNSAVAARYSDGLYLPLGDPGDAGPGQPKQAAGLDADSPTQ